MLRRVGVDEGDRGVGVRRDRDQPVTRQGRGDHVPPLQAGDERRDLALDRIGKGRARGHEGRRGVGPVLGLRDEIGGGDQRVGVIVREDHPLRWAGGHVDPHDPDDLELGRRDPGIAGADDPVDRLERRVDRARRPAEGQRPDGLGAAGDEHGIDLQEACGAEEDGMDDAARVGRRGDDDLADAGGLRGDDRHHERRGIRHRAAGHVAADAVERQPAALDLDATDDLGPIRPRPLAGGEPGDMIDHLVERASVGDVEPVAGRLEICPFEQEPAVGIAAAVPLVRLADRVGTARSDVGEDPPSAGPNVVIRDRAAADERAALGESGVIGRAEIDAADPDRLGEPARAGRRGFRRRGRGRHGTIFSIGRTRIPDAPAALRRGSRPQTSSAPTTAWIAIIPSCASGITEGDSSPGRSVSSSARWVAGAFIIRYLRLRAAITALTIVSTALSSSAR